MALAAADLLGSVVAPHPADTGRLDRLAVDDPGARLRISASPRAEALPQGGVESLPGTVEPPQAEVVVDGLPGWELVRQQPPGAAAPEGVEDPIEDLAQGMDARPSRLQRRGQVRLQAGILRIRPVSQIGSSRHTPDPSKSASGTFSDGF